MSTSQPLVDDYLRELERAARSLPRARRADLISEIRAHLREALPAGASAADIRTALDRLGDPDEIIAAEVGLAPRPIVRGRDWAAVFLLLLGGIVLPLLGWVAGAVLLWASSAWSVRQKVAGTFLLPGGLLPAVLGLLIAPTSGSLCAASSTSPVVRCTSTGPSAFAQAGLIAVFVLSVVVPIVTAVVLVRGLRRAESLAT
jgi:hypothetical protein